ncbi:hypothetical protein NQ317_000238, partial [Molorchus minor]
AFTRTLQHRPNTLKASNVDDIVEYYNNILSYINSTKNETLIIKNKAFPAQTSEFRELFKSILVQNFSFEIDAAESSRDLVNRINTWVEETTHEKVVNFIQPNMIENNLGLALLNNVNFYGKWAEPFNRAETVPGTFYLNDNETVQVEMMKTKREAYYKYLEYNNVQILQLPFTNDDISLFVVLQDKNANLTKGEKTEVNISLPKFKIGEDNDYMDVLKEMGVKELENSNLNEIFYGKTLNFSKIYEKGFIDINEEGSHIASGTMFTFVPSNVSEKMNPEDGLVIYEMDINSHVTNRFAKNIVKCKIKNINNSAKEATFTVILPKTGFITEFIMEIGGKAYKSYIKQKEEAKSVYQKAVFAGKSAGIVEADVRDSKEFNISVNLEPDAIGTFTLTYEEMLHRVHDQYELVLNIRPGQIAEKLNVEVNIEESRPLRFVKTPALRSGNEMGKNEEFLKPSTDIKIDSNSATVQFNPTGNQQKKIAGYLGSNIAKGFSGQFIVQYDVERDPHGGEILLQDGYFVHFFAPNDLDPLPKHVIFALDTSGSMFGRKVKQLMDAMMSILNQLRTNDVISFIEFKDNVVVWDINSQNSTTLSVFKDFKDPFSQLSETRVPSPTVVNQENINKAKNIVKNVQAGGGTFIIGGLDVALYLVKLGLKQNIQEKHQPIIVFLTDGQPNIGISSTEEIIEVITRINFQNDKVPIFSLSFGEEANKNFLRRLSLKNFGFSRHIYEAADASLQLQAFYKEISSPLLSDVEFKYSPHANDMTKSCFPIYFGGGELIVSGRYSELPPTASVNCCGRRGPLILRPTIEVSVTSLERLWAYMTATELAIKYSFVTEVTSLVVVKPDETLTVGVYQTDEKLLGPGFSSDPQSQCISPKHARRGATQQYGQLAESAESEVTSSEVVHEERETKKPSQDFIADHPSYIQTLLEYRYIVSKASKLKENFIFSPISFHEFLTLMSHDPGFEQEAFKRILDISDIDEVVKYYKNVLNYINSARNETNNLVQHLFDLDPADSSQDFFVDKINTWVEETTNKKVVNFIQPETLENNLRLALINDVSFDVSPEDGLVIYQMDINSHVSNRFAKNIVKCKIQNTNNTTKEATFTVTLPETAFITEFVMEIGGKAYKSYIKQKEEAKAIYQEAVFAGKSAGIVEAGARDSNEFNVSVNLEPDAIGIFTLTYEEMLQRLHDQYELVLNIRPGQIVKKLNVEVNIKESRPLRFVKTPAVRSGNEVGQNEDFLKPSTNIKIESNSATVKFNPTEKQQKTMAGYLGSNIAKGFSGQFVVQYDVERDPQGGEILLQDGYFVHFFAPNDLDPLPKHVLFVLDTSGSMHGRKIEQLKDAMMSILDQLRTNDVISIIEFNYNVLVWDINSQNSTTLCEFDNFTDPFPHLSETRVPSPTVVNQETINKAKKVIRDIVVGGCTFIIGGLEVALYLVKLGLKQNIQEKHQPIVVFLTDGQPNIGLGSTEEIIEVVTRLNCQNDKVPIFSLSFGKGADKNFLRRLSLKNFGFSRHIYEAADASLQLQAFYKQISSPLLSDVEFKYSPDAKDITKSRFPIYFGGAELIVSGRYSDSPPPVSVNCCGREGPVTLRPKVESSVSSLERLWAYMTVKQLLEKKESVDDKEEILKQAVELALKYSFVTEVTSLVVVKPDETIAVGDSVDQPFEELSLLSGPGSYYTF